MSIFDRIRRAPEPCPPLKWFVPPPNPLPAFCKRCGRALVRESTPGEFDERTGQRTFRNWLHCPKWKGDWTKGLGTPQGQVATQVRDDWSGFVWESYFLAQGYVSYLTCKKINKVESQPEPVA